MASTNRDDIGVRTLQVPNWERGINTSRPGTEIEDNEAQDILNFEFDDSGNISTRHGTLQLNATTFAKRITSAHYFRAESGEVGILFTTGTTVRIIQTNGTGLTNLTGALTLPDDTFWQWVTFQGIAIGVNKATTGDNPVKVTTVPVASALGGTPPKGKYIAVWNNRVWIISATAPNQLRGSKLGDPEDWTAAGDAGTVTIDIDPNDGDQITGLFPTREELFIFKRRRIYKIASINQAAAPTLASNLKVVIHTREIGCVSPYAISQMIDDVVFLSEQGLSSLRLVETTEGFRTTMYSRNVAEIALTPKATEEIPGFLFDTASQFWLSLPASISLTASAQVYVLDYLRLDDKLVRWTRFDGIVAGTAYTAFNESAGKVYVIGAPNGAGTHQLYTYRPKQVGGTFSDNGVLYSKRVTSKSYNLDLPLIRKHFHKWAIGITLFTTNAQVALQYFFDSVITKGGSSSFNLTTGGAGALWDSALWDVGLWDSAVTIPQDIVRKLVSNSSGQRGQHITFVITNAQNDQGFSIRDFMLFYSLLTEKKVSEV